MKFSSNKDLTEWMMKTDYALSREKDIFEFLREYAERKKLFDKIHLRTNSIDVFVDDLVKNKIIEIS
ncbi:hypothetical protein GCM10027051_32650 [Niabella terrae]